MKFIELTLENGKPIQVRASAVQAVREHIYGHSRTERSTVSIGSIEFIVQETTYQVVKALEACE